MTGTADNVIHATPDCALLGLDSFRNNAKSDVYFGLVWRVTMDPLGAQPLGGSAPGGLSPLETFRGCVLQGSGALEALPQCLRLEPLESWGAPLLGALGGSAHGGLSPLVAGSAPLRLSPLALSPLGAQPLGAQPLEGSAPWGLSPWRAQPLGARPLGGSPPWGLSPLGLNPLGARLLGASAP